VSFSVLIPWREDPARMRILAWVLERWAADFPDAELILGRSPEGDFNRGAALNDAASRATTDVYVVADADTTYANPSILRQAVAAVATGTAAWSLPYARYYNLRPDLTERVLAGRPTGVFPEPAPEDFDHRLLDSVSGIVVVPARGWKRIGGFDERFRGWGYDDDAFASALLAMVGPCRRYPSAVLHLWHPNGLRFDSPGIADRRALAARYQRAERRPVEMAALLAEAHPS
jgi:glycosyltransferase involved in cell wall biosynthesis